jgi:uncharacterized membrane protein
MGIPVTCDCGRSLRVKDEAAGRKVRCPACGAAIAVPQPDTNPDIEDEALDLLLAAPDRPASAPQPASAAAPDEEPPRSSSKPTVPPPAPHRPSNSPRPKPSARREKSEKRGLSIAAQRSIIVGLLMMLGAAVWFFLGLAAGRIFFYPPIMFVLGIGAVIRGFQGHE